MGSGIPLLDWTKMKMVCICLDGMNVMYDMYLTGPYSPLVLLRYIFLVGKGSVIFLLVLRGFGPLIVQFFGHYEIEFLILHHI